ncbi:target of Sbf [Aphanomyces cochlioides]|nr:target of Sbf [Aphanomyces cochlioides]
MAYDHASPGVREANSVVAYRETDWVSRPTDLKDTEEFARCWCRYWCHRCGVFLGLRSLDGLSGTYCCPHDCCASSVPSAATKDPSTPDATTSVPEVTYSIADLNSTASGSLNSTTIAPNATFDEEVSVGSTGRSTESLAISDGTTPAPTTDAPTTTTTPTPAPTPSPTTAKMTPAPTPPTTTGPLAPGYMRFVNNCPKKYTLWQSAKDSPKQAVAQLGTGETYEINDRQTFAAMFFLSSNSDSLGDATLFETNFGWGDMFYFDISIIPVGCGDSWDTCVGGKHYAFNVPMTVTPSKTGGVSCRKLVCSSTSDCNDGYHIPNGKDTKTCPSSVSMIITFC